MPATLEMGFTLVSEDEKLVTRESLPIIKLWTKGNLSPLDKSYYSAGDLKQMLDQIFKQKTLSFTWSYTDANGYIFTGLHNTKQKFKIFIHFTIKADGSKNSNSVAVIEHATVSDVHGVGKGKDLTQEVKITWEKEQDYSDQIGS